MNSKRATTSDAQLVALALAHDQEAFGEIYDRYADDIYSFCRSRLRNDADAADATQETFVRAATRMQQLREPTKLRSWLFAIARNQIVATGKAANRATGGDSMADVIDLRSDIDGDLLRTEASAQLWDAASGLSDRDQEVLELHVRHGLSGQALADAMGVSESHANVLLTRMKDRIATSLGGLLVARSGRDDCEDLDQLLAGWDGRFTLDLRSRVTRHIRSCEVCDRTQSVALAAGAFALPITAAPSGLRVGTVGRMVESAKLSSPPSAGGDGGVAVNAASASGSLAKGTWEWRPDGFPFPNDEPAVIPAPGMQTPWLLSAAVFVLVVLLGAGAWLLFGDPQTTTVAVAGQTEVNTSTTSEPAATSSSSAAESTAASSAAAQATTTVAVELATPTSIVAAAGGDDPPLAAPTTIAPTTIAPTTIAPTTVAPTTDAPTTGAPSSAAPTTIAPTTAAPTTEAPPPTTEAPPPTTETPPPSSEEPPPSSEEPPPTTEEPPPEIPNRAPIVRLSDATPLGVGVRSGGCRGERTQLLVEIVDDGEVVSVVATWSPSDGTTAEQVLTSQDGTVFTGPAGPWDETGPHRITIVATDDRGETGTGQAGVRVTACAIGGFTG